MVFPYLIFSLLVFLSRQILGNFVLAPSPQFGLIIFFWFFDLICQILTLKMTLVLLREEKLVIPECLAECGRKILVFIFASAFGFFISFYIALLFSFLFISAGQLMVAVFILTALLINLIVFLWPMEIIAENKGPLSAFGANFYKLKSFPGQFFSLVFLILIIQFFGYLFSFQLGQVPQIGDLLQGLTIGLFLAVSTIMKMVGFLNLGQK